MATVRQRDVSTGVSDQDEMKESVALAVRKSGPRGQWEDGSPQEVWQDLAEPGANVFGRPFTPSCFELMLPFLKRSGSPRER